MNKDILRIMTNAHKTARRMTPIESGVLRYDATHVRITNYGFDVYWLKTVAPHVEILQEGRGYNAQHKDFLDQIGHTIARQIANGVMGKKDNSLTWQLEENQQTQEEVNTREMRAVKRKRIANYRMGAYAKK